ncbi:uncharacterized protein BT62DRAFT_1004268 [Guyanagaster necrorhizus]|uniref:Uncharacterized protein n=1 Tax=Guyanagaster necrorhizus TaxID=856835 RepID=A0A9P7VWM4_9AGAR|nr:uncharacterized protein BT62DRAFT_1004268 [Guyanagaster necrorhizus MCA 3950]KAG7447524.1 hypothetical protein BT62DRAFT_1004268 [Guyanagaster necrorhizus MCA 3950]
MTRGTHRIVSRQYLPIYLKGQRVMVAVIEARLVHLFDRDGICQYVPPVEADRCSTIIHFIRSQYHGLTRVHSLRLRHIHSDGRIAEWTTPQQQEVNVKRKLSNSVFKRTILILPVPKSSPLASRFTEWYSHPSFLSAWFTPTFKENVAILVISSRPWLYCTRHCNMHLMPLLGICVRSPGGNMFAQNELRVLIRPHLTVSIPFSSCFKPAQGIIAHTANDYLYYFEGDHRILGGAAVKLIQE